MSTSNLASGVPLDAVAQTYDQRRLDELSDADLLAAVGEIVAVPRERRADSFVLHAPLELTARSRLLPLIVPPARRLARLHLVAIAAQYEAFSAGVAPPPPLGSPVGETGLDELLLGIERGDLDLVDQAAVRLSETSIDPATVLHRLAPAVVPKTGAAAHAPIYLAFVHRSGGSGEALLPLLRPLVRDLAHQPDWRIRWVEEQVNVDGSQDDGPLPIDSGALFEALATGPRLGPAESTFIHPTMMLVDQGGLAESVLGHLVGRPSPDAARSVLRVAALSMVHDTADHAPYGWTHCLTLPQAVITLAPYLGPDDGGLAIAATHVLAFRSAFGTVDLVDDELVRPLPTDVLRARITALASAAATRHDAHIVKYALAVIEAAMADRDAAELYLTAGEHLLAVWDRNGGDPTDPLIGESPG